MHLGQGRIGNVYLIIFAVVVLNIKLVLELHVNITFFSSSLMRINVKSFVNKRTIEPFLSEQHL